MRSIFEFTIDDYIEICERAKNNGVKTGESMEKEMFEYAKEKGIQPIGNTELNKDELIKEYESKGKKVLDMTKKDKK